LVSGSRATRKKIHDHGWEDYYKLRKHWSRAIMFCFLPTVIVFQIVLVSSVGLGGWRFTGNAVFLNTIAGELFMQIAGMGYIVVKFLFQPKGNDVDDSDDSQAGAGTKKALTP
jgi:hypothetical protein